jgi:hypothetical protein
LHKNSWLWLNDSDWWIGSDIVISGSGLSWLPAIFLLSSFNLARAVASKMFGRGRSYTTHKQDDLKEFDIYVWWNLPPQFQV